MNVKRFRAAYRQTLSTVYDWVGTMVAALVAIVLFFSFLVQGVSVSGDSMEPTLHSGDRLFLSRLSNDYTYGDIIVVDRYAIEPLIKRVVAVGGDLVEITKDCLLYVNGVAVEELYTQGLTVPRDMDGPVMVPEGHVFVLGDNRGISKDSRMTEIGMISVKDIVGKAVLRYWPFSSFGSPYGNLEG